MFISLLIKLGLMKPKSKQVVELKMPYKQWECSEEAMNIRRQYSPLPYQHHAMTEHLHRAYEEYSGISPCENCSCDYLRRKAKG